MNSYDENHEGRNEGVQLNSAPLFSDMWRMSPYPYPYPYRVVEGKLGRYEYSTNPKSPSQGLNGVAVVLPATDATTNNCYPQVLDHGPQPNPNLASWDGWSVQNQFNTCNGNGPPGLVQVQTWSTAAGRDNFNGYGTHDPELPHPTHPTPNAAATATASQKRFTPISVEWSSEQKEAPALDLASLLHSMHKRLETCEAELSALKQTVNERNGCSIISDYGHAKRMAPTSGIVSLKDDECALTLKYRPQGLNKLNKLTNVYKDLKKYIKTFEKEDGKPTSYDSDFEDISGMLKFFFKQRHNRELKGPITLWVQVKDKTRKGEPWLEMARREKWLDESEANSEIKGIIINENSKKEVEFVRATIKCVLDDIKSEPSGSKGKTTRQNHDHDGGSGSGGSGGNRKRTRKNDKEDPGEDSSKRHQDLASNGSSGSDETTKRSKSSSMDDTKEEDSGNFIGRDGASKNNQSAFTCDTYSPDATDASSNDSASERDIYDSSDSDDEDDDDEGRDGQSGELDIPPVPSAVKAPNHASNDLGGGSNIDYSSDSDDKETDNYDDIDGLNGSVVPSTANILKDASENESLSKGSKKSQPHSATEGNSISNATMKTSSSSDDACSKRASDGAGGEASAYNVRSGPIGEPDSFDDNEASSSESESDSNDSSETDSDDDGSDDDADEQPVADAIPPALSRAKFLNHASNEPGGRWDINHYSHSNSDSAYKDNSNDDSVAEFPGSIAIPNIPATAHSLNDEFKKLGGSDNKDCGNGNGTEALPYAHENDCQWDTKTCSAAARMGQLELLKYVHENGCPWDTETCSAAARMGHLEVLKYAHENGCPWDSQTCTAAAEIGHLKALTYAHEMGCPWDTKTCSAAATKGHLEVLTYAHENGCPWDANTCSAAARMGHLEVLKYAHENGCPWDANTCYAAAIMGHLEVLKYAHENGCPWDTLTCSAAARMGHLEVLNYAHEMGCPWDTKTCSAAATKGHMKVLTYAHENGCPWDANTCTAAAEMGHLEVLKYAHENGCPWDANTCTAAAEMGHLEVLKYAHENGCPWDANTCSFAYRNGHFRAWKYALKNGCPWDGKIWEAARMGHCF